MRFVVTDKAEADLKNIFDFIAKGSPVTAARYTEELLTGVIDQLDVFPESCPIHNELLNIRRYSYEKYNVYYEYKPDEKTVFILHVIHSSKLLNSTLKRQKWPANDS